MTDALKTWHSWKEWQVLLHLYHFTPETLKILLVKSSFRLVKYKDYLSKYVKDKIDKAFRIGSITGLLTKKATAIYQI